MIYRFLAFFFGLASPGPVRALPSQEVKAFMEERWRLFDARKAEATAALYVDDATVINVTGDYYVGIEAIAGFYRRLFERLATSDLGPRRCKEASVQMIGSDVAIVTEECTLYDILPIEKAKGRRLPIRHFIATHVLVRREEGWKIIAFRNIPIWNPFAWEGPNQ